ncbi:MAG: PTS system mannose/fructose/sorbose family transporter subunit IID [Elusimicrobiaceae bacterium]|nr:PTS system mannose/fructose/sorbose family transporter subunit IID [Elusimicrobiaceae bacterium]MBQ6224507.1 PTS system mannose/fructose/sorbose family transporter subunit IID [Campylobacter sp.]
MKINFFKIFLRTFLLQIFWNYRKMQNIGRLFVVMPILRNLYKDNPDMLKRAISRNLDAFNSNPVMASYSIGAMIKQEEKIAKTEQVRLLGEEREWRVISVSTANAAASLGDRLFWATLKPFSLLFLIITLYATQIYTLKNLDTPADRIAAAIGAVVLSLLVYNIPALLVRYKGLKDSYDGTEDSFYGLIKLNWNRIIYTLKTTGQILTFALFVYSLYINFAGEDLSADLLTRTALLVSFLVLSVWTRKLNIPNIYLYIAATFIFCVASFIS